jgi:hypothetical protein
LGGGHFLHPQPGQGGGIFNSTFLNPDEIFFNVLGEETLESRIQMLYSRRFERVAILDPDTGSEREALCL